MNCIGFPQCGQRRVTLATSCVLGADDPGRGSTLKRGSGLNLNREQIEAARSQLGGWGDDRAAEAVRRSVLAALRICHHHQLNETFRTSGGNWAFVGSFPARWNARCRSSSGPPQLTAQGAPLEIDVRKRLPGGVLHDEARIVMLLDGPRRRETAHGLFGNARQAGS